MLDLACALRISGMDLVHQTSQRLAPHRHHNFALAVLICRVIPAQSYPTLYVLSTGVLVAVLFGFLLLK